MPYHEFMYCSDLFHLMYQVSLPWKLTMFLKKQKMQGEQVLLKLFYVKMLLRNTNRD